MEIIGDGDWDSRRWSELIERSLIFSRDSGLDLDASRSEIIGAANESIGSSGYSERLSAMLCMLGESAVVLPSKLPLSDHWQEIVISNLEMRGLGATSASVASDALNLH